MVSGIMGFGVMGFGIMGFGVIRYYGIRCNGSPVIPKKDKEHLFFGVNRARCNGYCMQ